MGTMRRGRHPNSLANLRPSWRKGQSGNPRGMNTARREREARRLALGILDAIEAAYERGDEAQAEALLEHFARAIIRAGCEGDPYILRGLFARLFPVAR